MCIISDKIKFCTCVTENVEKLKHYWILHRYEKNKGFDILGECIAPASYRDPNFVLNKLTLENRLNEPDAFDKPMNFSSKDQLEISINNKSKDYGENLTYYLIFQNGKWKYEDTSPFDIMNDYVTEDSGKIKSALEKEKTGNISNPSME